jgi:hypothetical protein
MESKTTSESVFLPQFYLLWRFDMGIALVYSKSYIRNNDIFGVISVTRMQTLVVHYLQ